jgi:hypothetical protein
MMSVEQSVEWELAGETEVLGENLPQCHSSLQIPHELSRDRLRAAAVGSQRPVMNIWVPLKAGNSLLAEGLFTSQEKRCSIELISFNWRINLASCVSIYNQIRIKKYSLKKKPNNVLAFQTTHFFLQTHELQKRCKIAKNVSGNSL